MFARYFFASLLSLLALVAARTLPLNGDSSGQCSVGVLQCCTTTQAITGDAGAPVLEVATNCVDFFAGNTCDTRPVCCTNKSSNGIVASGCNSFPVNTASGASSNGVIGRIIDFIGSGV